MFSLSNLGAITDVHSGCRWTSDDLRRQIAGRRANLAGLNVTGGDRVVIAHGGTPDFFADLIAAWSLGACAACVNPMVTRGELATFVNFVEPRVVLIKRDQNAAVDGLKGTVADISDAKRTNLEVSEALKIGDGDPALLLFTSGSTGNPKGVLHTGATLSARLALNQQHISDASLARSLCVLPTHFGHGLIGNCLTPLTAGHHLHLFPSPGINGAARLGDVIRDHQITFLSSVPAFWKVVLKVAPPPEAESLRRISIGSAPLSAELWKSVISWSGINNVCNMYGITETANWAAGASAESCEPEDGLVGTMWGGDVAVLTSQGVVQSNGEGEILLRTPSLMPGYYRRSDLTQEVIRDRWYHTGDRGSVDEDGRIRLLGRLKTQINRAGTKILPEEIDLLLERHPQVAEACTFGVPDPINGEIVGIALRLLDESVETSELRQWCVERIRGECVPEKWYVLPEIPKTDRGKVKRSMVRDACLKAET